MLMAEAEVVIQVAVPQGVAPGQQFRAVVDGREMVVTCPSSATPGSLVRIMKPKAPPPAQELPLAYAEALSTGPAAGSPQPAMAQGAVAGVGAAGSPLSMPPPLASTPQAQAQAQAAPQAYPQYAPPAAAGGAPQYFEGAAVQAVQAVPQQQYAAPGAAPQEQQQPPQYQQPPPQYQQPQYQQAPAQADPNSFISPTFRPTKLCRRWQEQGLADGQPCSFPACTFAHGQSQIGQPLVQGAAAAGAAGAAGAAMAQAYAGLAHPASAGGMYGTAYQGGPTGYGNAGYGGGGYVEESLYFFYYSVVCGARNMALCVHQHLLRNEQNSPSCDI